MKKIRKILALALILSMLTAGICAVADGDWSVKTSIGSMTNDKPARQALKKALKNYTGYELKPLALLGTQVVAGTNYCILCYGSTVTQKPTHSLCKVYVYEDLSGNAKITRVDEIKLEEASSTGWKISNSRKALTVDKKAKSALKKATAGLVGATYKPLLMLGKARKKHNGYCLLCQGKLSDLSGTTGLSIVVLKKTKGKYAIQRIEDLNVAG